MFAVPHCLSQQPTQAFWPQWFDMLCTEVAVGSKLQRLGLGVGDHGAFTQPGDERRFVLRAKDATLAQNWESLRALLQTNTDRVIAAIRAVPGDALNDEVAMPWGTQTMAQIIAYPYWNMTYHEGQINYIASLLGCLE